MDDKDKPKDTRPVCKYGQKCYQKNPTHQEKYRHPKRPPQDPIRQLNLKRPKLMESEENSTASVEDMEENSPPSPGGNTESATAPANSVRKEEVSDDEDPAPPAPADKTVNVDHKKFIEEKFLLKMPDDFYNFWNFCKALKPNQPADAFRDVGITLVGPYDVLAGKFKNVHDKSDEEYLVHWRYYYDPPELQTVIKGNDFKGFHIGYFRDDPKDAPVFLASNSAKTDGVLQVMGPNIFAAIYSYLEDMKKSCNPFQKINIQKHQLAIKKRAEELDLELKRRNSDIKIRDAKIVTRLFNKIGLVVPYNRKTQLGYRGLALNEKDLKALLLKIKNGAPEQMTKLLTELQPVLTYASIATDECDFGTGIELGLNILFFGVDNLNGTVATYLSNSYKLLQRQEFVQIIDAHMKNRRKGSNLSILD